MTFQIIIRGREEGMRRLKGKNVTEFSKHLESEGWPSELPSEETRDRLKFLEKKIERPVTRKDIRSLETKFQKDAVRKMSKKLGLKEFKRGMPKHPEDE